MTIAAVRIADETISPWPRTKPWVDEPPLDEDWLPVSGAEAEDLIARLESLTKNAVESGQIKREQVENIRAALPGFYPRFLLLDIQISCVQPGAGRSSSRIGSLIYGPNGVTPLDGRSLPVYALNTTRLDLADDRSALSYLRFFCAFIRGEEGQFALIDRPEALAFVPNSDEASRARAVQTFFEPRMLHCGGNGWRFEGLVAYGPHLYRSIFDVTKDGFVSMVEDEPLLEGAPLRQRRYDGMFRYPPE